MGLIGSAFTRLKEGLARTRRAAFSGLRSFLRGRSLDEALLKEIEARLLKADVGVKAATRIIEDLRRAHAAGEVARGDEVIGFLKERLKAMWPAENRALRVATFPPSVILVTGVNGSGKTTSVAKLAHLLRTQGKSVLLGACDTFRAGAVRQLEIWSERLGVDVVKGQQGGDPAAVAFDACQAALSRGTEVLILDTAGRLHTQDNLMRQLVKIREVIARKIPGAPHEVLLVLDATNGQNALRQAQEFARAASVSGIFLSKLDGTARGGVVVAIQQETGIPVKLVGVGETPDDVEPFDPGRFVDAMFADEDESS